MNIKNEDLVPGKLYKFTTISDYSSYFYQAKNEYKEFMYNSDWILKERIKSEQTVIVCYLKLIDCYSNWETIKKTKLPLFLTEFGLGVFSNDTFKLSDITS